MAKQRIFKPGSDDQFLEQVSFIRFVSGFNYAVVKARWPRIREAFHNFSIPRLAKADDGDTDRIAGSDGMIKNRIKIRDTLLNARICREIAGEHGSVIKWIAFSKKRHLNDPLLEPSLAESFRRFHGIGETTSGWLEALHMAKGNCLTYEVPDRVRR